MNFQYQIRREDNLLKTSCRRPNLVSYSTYPCHKGDENTEKKHGRAELKKIKGATYTICKMTESKNILVQTVQQYQPNKKKKNRKYRMQYQDFQLKAEKVQNHISYAKHSYQTIISQSSKAHIPLSCTKYYIS